MGNQMGDNYVTVDLCAVKEEKISKLMDSLLDRINYLAIAEEKSLDNLKDIMNIMSAAQNQALATAKMEMDRRLEGMNEFRKQLSEQVDTFVDKGYYEIQHKFVIDRLDRQRTRVDELQLWRSALEGKSSWSNFIAVVALAVSVLFGILHFVSGIAAVGRP